MKLLLFDVDGTLVLTGGAGVRAMNRAFLDVFGVPDAFRGVKMAGGTDPRLLDEAVARAGITLEDGSSRAFEQTYLRHLAEEIRKPLSPDTGGLPPSHPRTWRGPLPGVTDLLEALLPRDDVFLALLTGNYTKGAEIKLSHFDLWRYFRCGAFGEDAALRHGLVPVAVARARTAGCPHLHARDVVIVGDTVRDVDCARHAGIGCVAVATGGDRADTLRDAGADAVFDTFENTAAVVETLVS
ncbi:MAG: HAD family hydrolase [Acidobacteria bacterium]|nr:HAD family hydrolase [Acidobacteriota bacterium]